jgi:hypothetical protein
MSPRLVLAIVLVAMLVGIAVATLVINLEDPSPPIEINPPPTLSFRDDLIANRGDPYGHSAACGRLEGRITWTFDDRERAELQRLHDSECKEP